MAGIEERSNNTPILQISGMNKRYGDRVIFNDFSLTVNAGEMICICGASGSGKSTLLNIIGMFEKANSGEVRLFGERIPDRVYQAADWRLASRAAAVSRLRSKEDGSANLTQDPKLVRVILWHKKSSGRYDMVERRPKIRITVIDRRGKLGCHRGHHVGEVFDFDEDRGRICPMAMHCAFPYIDILRYGGSIPGQPAGTAEFC